MLKGSGTSSPFMTCFIVFRVFLEWKKLVDRGTTTVLLFLLQTTSMTSSNG